MSERRTKKVRLSPKKLQAYIAAMLETCDNAETRGTYERCLRTFVRWSGRRRNFRFRAEDFREYKRYLTDVKGLSVVSVSTYLTATRRLCALLVERDVLAENPVAFIKGNSRSKAHVRMVLSDADVDRLLGTLNGTDEIGMRDTAIVLLMLDCGLSGAELVHADAGDLEKDTLQVQGKGRKSKDASVVLTGRSLEALRRYRHLCESLDSANAAPFRPLLLSAGNRTRGERMSTRGIRQVVNAYLEEAGIKTRERRNISPHSLRHTAARRMAASGASAEEIQQRLRLGSVATANLYLMEEGEKE